MDMHRPATCVEDPLRGEHAFSVVPLADAPIDEPGLILCSRCGELRSPRIVNMAKEKEKEKEKEKSICGRIQMSALAFAWEWLTAGARGRNTNAPDLKDWKDALRQAGVKILEDE